ncbi:helix-turn-helix transcriptional regulator [Bacteroidota bacterium]
MQLKNRIREYRARHNMAQEELAAKVGVRRETIGRLEMNKYNPSLLLALEIAKVFDVTIEELFQTIEE